jgi:tripartite-type tricarboxylate transporter receptor subunit TctC
LDEIHPCPLSWQPDSGLGGQPDRPDIYTAGVVAPPAGGKRQSLRGDKRGLPGASTDIPTFAEIGLPALSYSAWGGLFAPKATPKDIVSKLKFAAVEALADPVVPARPAPFGMELFPHERQTPEALAAMQKADAEKWWPLIKELGIKAE